MYHQPYPTDKLREGLHTRAASQGKGVYAEVQASELITRENQTYVQWELEICDPVGMELVGMGVESTDGGVNLRSVLEAASRVL